MVLVLVAAASQASGIGMAPWLAKVDVYMRCA
jgi:hypothetical protein